MNHRPNTGIPGREAQKHALVEALLREEGLTLPAGQGIRRREGVDSAPLSSVQERLWLLDQLGAARAAFNRPVALRLSGVLDPAVTEEALAAIARRHEVLRTSFP